ncbi:VWA domain-containing protein [Vibrio chagasii]|nr:VWA domain-containing protein [Vibrio chagasii]
MREQLGRDVMVVVDLSGSMAEQDFTSKQENLSLGSNERGVGGLCENPERRPLRLILFGDAAFVQTPFTADQDVWLELLNQTDARWQGSIPLGISGLAIKGRLSRAVSRCLSNASNDIEREKVVIVLTDGTTQAIL